MKGGYEAGKIIVESVNLFSHLANVGDTRSLIIHPASTTHRQLTEEQLIAAGAGPEVIRVSIGLESIEDIIDDLEHELSQCEPTYYSHQIKYSEAAKYLFEELLSIF